MRPGTDFLQRTLWTFGFSSGAGRTTKKDQSQAEIVPILSWDNLHQIKFNFNRIFIFGEAKSV